MIFTIDVEDWRQSTLDFANPISTRVLNNTYKLLDILDLYSAKGTFFIQGKITEKYPNLIRAIYDAGHEVASHAYSHKPLFSMNKNTFECELKKSIYPLEDIIGEKVIGFRAPDFSISEKMLPWYCESLINHGIRYDSSIFPIKLPRYGIAGKHVIDIFKKAGLDQHTLMVSKLFKINLPVLGGGYFRFYPYWLTKYLIKTLDNDESVFYMHPYELDNFEYAEIKRNNKIPFKLLLSQFSGRSTIKPKLVRLLKDYRMQSFKEKYYL